jgi:hypothetical protein
MSEFDAELAVVREINAHLPFAHPIMPDRRREAFDRLVAFSQKHGLYDNDF